MLVKVIENPIIREAGIKITHPLRHVVIGVCPCGENIYAGDSAWEFEDEWYCNAVHFARHMGARKVESA